MSDLSGYCPACVARALPEAREKLELVKAKLAEPIPDEPGLYELVEVGHLVFDVGCGPEVLLSAGRLDLEGECGTCKQSFDRRSQREGIRPLRDLLRLVKMLHKEISRKQDLILCIMRGRVQSECARRDAERLARRRLAP